MQQDYAHTPPPVQNASPTPPGSPVSTQKRRSVGFVYLIPIGLLLGFLLFAIAYGVNQFTSASKEELAVAVTPTVSQPDPTVTVAPSPTEVEEEEDEEKTPSPTKSATGTKDVSILVLNGSGEGGVAGKMKTALTGLGYTDIVTGNAEEYTYTGLQIRTKSEQTAAEALRKSLMTDYTVSAVTKTASSEADIIVIVGKNARKAP